MTLVPDAEAFARAAGDGEWSAATTRLRQRLIADAHPEGGWGYYAGKAPRIESTAWALLALADPAGPHASAWEEFAAPHLKFLSASQRSDGLLVERPGLFPNFTSNAVAACVLSDLSVGTIPVLAPLLNALTLVKGIKVDAYDARQDNQLQGWSWMPSTFSWVEPTAWCMIALKTSRAAIPAAGAARLREAETLLANRSCAAGGWNYGNASALGQDLRPYVPTTALGLLALQDRPGDPSVDRALTFLDAARLKEASAMALALVALCLRIFGRSIQDVEQRLAGDVDRIERIGNLHAMAMAIYALEAGRHGARALRV